VDRPIVTYWEIGNETDIGEQGGCPYLITNANDYLRTTNDYRSHPRHVPSGQSGRPAVANGDGTLLPDFVELCAKEGTRLDFISWHLYSDDPRRHARSRTSTVRCSMPSSRPDGPKCS